MGRTRNTVVELAPGVFYSLPASFARNGALLAVLREGYEHPEAASGAPSPRTQYHEACDTEPAPGAPRDLAARLAAVARLMAFSVGYAVRQEQALGFLAPRADGDGKMVLEHVRPRGRRARS